MSDPSTPVAAMSDEATMRSLERMLTISNEVPAEEWLATTRSALQFMRRSAARPAQEAPSPDVAERLAVLLFKWENSYDTGNLTMDEAREFAAIAVRDLGNFPPPSPDVAGLIERLRDGERTCERIGLKDASLYGAAANEIERLTTALAALSREAQEAISPPATGI